MFMSPPTLAPVGVAVNVSQSRSAVKSLSDDALEQSLIRKLKAESTAVAEVLIDIAEFDRRRLYRPAGHPSMHSYCTCVRGMSKSDAGKKIWVARTARRFPAIFDRIAENRIHLSGMAMLAGYLTTANAAELLAAAEHKTCEEIAVLLASRFPKPDVPTRIARIPTPIVPEIATTCGESYSVRNTPPAEHQDSVTGSAEPVPVSEPEPALLSAPGKQTAAPRTRITPLAPARYGLQFTIPQETRDLLQEAQDLLGFEIAPNDLAALFHRSLEALIAERRKRKFGATTRPRASAVNHSNPSGHVSRHVPAHVRRIVVSRDQGQCTFVGPDGRRCPSRIVEFDHVQEFARGGDTSVANLRLRCRAHNQLTAESTFGAGFMEAKRPSGTG